MSVSTRTTVYFIKRADVMCESKVDKESVWKVTGKGGVFNSDVLAVLRDTPSHSIEADSSQPRPSRPHVFLWPAVHSDRSSNQPGQHFKQALGDAFHQLFHLVAEGWFEPSAELHKSPFDSVGWFCSEVNFPLKVRRTGSGSGRGLHTGPPVHPTSKTVRLF